MVSAPLQSSPTPTQRSTGGRRWLFRLGAVLLGLSPFLAFEGLCVLFDWGRPSLHDDPFVGFRSTRPLFVLNDDGTRYEIPKARQAYFRPESFAADKPADEFRVFVLGGSTVAGRPFGIETSFTTWLEIALAAADPSHRWEVVNCGGISYASYRLVPVLAEVLQYHPDLIILCTGHNEFLEARTFDHIARRGEIFNTSLAAASRWRTFNLAREALLRTQHKSSSEPPASRPILPTEVEALLDYRGGLEEYHHDETRRRGIIAHYEYNLRWMVQMTHDAGVPIILVNPVCNLAATPPFKAEHGPDLSADELSQWDALSDEARQCLRGQVRDVQRAARLFERACQIDPQHAGGWYNLAKCYEAAEAWNDALRAYTRAKDADVCPLRILEPMHESVLRVARQMNVPLADAQRLFASRSEHGIVGGRWLVDHVHPSIEGHQLLAEQLLAVLADERIVDPQPGWEENRRLQFAAHHDALDNLYFHQGMQKLKSLQDWSAGRARRMRPAARRAAAVAAPEAEEK